MEKEILTLEESLNEPDYLQIIYDKLQEWNRDHPEANMSKYQTVSRFVKTLPEGIKLDFKLPKFKNQQQEPLVHLG